MQFQFCFVCWQCLSIVSIWRITWIFSYGRIICSSQCHHRSSGVTVAKLGHGIVVLELEHDHYLTHFGIVTEYKSGSTLAQTSRYWTTPDLPSNVFRGVNLKAISRRVLKLQFCISEFENNFKISATFPSCQWVKQWVRWWSFTDTEKVSFIHTPLGQCDK